LETVPHAPVTPDALLARTGEALAQLGLAPEALATGAQLARLVAQITEDCSGARGRTAAAHRGRQRALWC
jgi:hypothetical protein